MQIGYKKNIGLLLFLATLFLSYSFAFAQKLSSLCQHELPLLVYDAPNTSEIFPNHFRKMNASYKKINIKPPSHLGLEEVHASGSAQFTPEQLSKIKSELKEYRVIVVDMRQESHGFVDQTNDFTQQIQSRAIEWYGFHNSENRGKTLSLITQDEASKLNKLKDKANNIFAYDTVKRIKQRSCNLEQEKIYVQDAYSERELAENLSLGYVRIPVTDFHIPSDADIDKLVKLIDSLKQNEWIHVHCRGGKGRTTTTLIMYDMLINAHQVSFDDILKRQVLMGGKDLTKEGEKKKGRYELLKQFYDYARARRNDFTGSWTEWKKQHRLTCISSDLI